MVKVFLATSFNSSDWEKDFHDFATKNGVEVDTSAVYQKSTQTKAHRKSRKAPVVYVTTNIIYYECTYNGTDVDIIINKVEKDGKVTAVQCMVQEDMF